MLRKKTWLGDGATFARLWRGSSKKIHPPPPIFTWCIASKQAKRFFAKRIRFFRAHIDEYVFFFFNCISEFLKRQFDEIHIEINLLRFCSSRRSPDILRVQRSPRTSLSFGNARRFFSRFQLSLFHSHEKGTCQTRRWLPRWRVQPSGNLLKPETRYMLLKFVFIVVVRMWNGYFKDLIEHYYFHMNPHISLGFPNVFVSLGKSSRSPFRSHVYLPSFPLPSIFLWIFQAKLATQRQLVRLVLQGNVHSPQWTPWLYVALSYSCRTWENVSAHRHIDIRFLATAAWKTITSCEFVAAIKR